MSQNGLLYNQPSADCGGAHFPRTAAAPPPIRNARPALAPCDQGQPRTPLCAQGPAQRRGSVSVCRINHMDKNRLEEEPEGGSGAGEGFC